MITTKYGSIFDSSAQVLVCPVNCVGVMGKGLALEFKRRMGCQSYFVDCSMQYVRPGESRYAIAQQHGDRSIMYAATKKHWRSPSKIEWVDGCLKDINAFWWMWKFKSIALPQLGCGCGGLDWADVWPLYEKHLGDLPIDVEVWVWQK